MYVGEILTPGNYVTFHQQKLNCDWIWIIFIHSNINVRHWCTRVSIESWFSLYILTMDGIWFPHGCSTLWADERRYYIRILSNYTVGIACVEQSFHVSLVNNSSISLFLPRKVSLTEQIWNYIFKLTCSTGLQKNGDKRTRGYYNSGIF